MRPRSGGWPGRAAGSASATPRWPEATSPDEDDALPVSTELAAADAAAAIADGPAVARRSRPRRPPLVLRRELPGGRVRPPPPPLARDAHPIAGAGPEGPFPALTGRRRRRAVLPPHPRPGPVRCSAHPPGSWSRSSWPSRRSAGWRRPRSAGRSWPGCGRLRAAVPTAPRRASIRLASEAELAARQLADERADHDLLLDTLASGVLDIDGDGHIRPRTRPRARCWAGAADAPWAHRHGGLPRPDGRGGRARRLETGHRLRRAAPGRHRRLALVVRARRSGGAAWLIEDVSELRRLQRIRAEFIDNLSHELRTPLTTVSLLAETLPARQPGRAGVPAKMRDRIGRSRSRWAISSRWSTSSSTCPGSRAAGPSSWPTASTWAGWRPMPRNGCACSPNARASRSAVEVEPDLPPVRGDVARLGQVVVNLVHNAVKFSPDGGDVTSAWCRDGDEVVVAVEDHGVGIPRAAQARVFERFYKVDRARLRAEAAAGRASDSPSPAMSSSSTGADLGQSEEGVARRSPSPSRRPPPGDPPTADPEDPWTGCTSRRSTSEPRGPLG